MKTSHKKTTPVTENETFIRLIQAAQDDPDFRTQIVSILTLNSFNRKSVLNTIIDSMRLNNVSEELIEAIASICDDDVAAVALKTIEGKES